MTSVPLRAHKLEIPVYLNTLNTTNTPLTHMLPKTQWAIMKEVKRGSFYNLYIIHFPLVFITNNSWKGISCQRKVIAKKSWDWD